ncbi:hypothetical protein KKC1_17950 [Calderihabitans maritimus]|uniref:Uncharacterized protein n=1 Tax=Calderihabitans maritimus TaxID=1246530 RepID=A0A1Z5HT00_9FIRM|nr:hypothetical protein KKC1_17950 [Calderihabitans maritimus]
MAFTQENSLAKGLTAGVNAINPELVWPYLYFHEAFQAKISITFEPSYVPAQAVWTPQPAPLLTVVTL